MSDTAPFKYRRLPGRGNRTRGGIPVIAARCSLWVGPDHILSLDRIMTNEEYKRFYFRDIQSITVQRTNNSSAWNWGFGSFALITISIFAIAIGSSNQPSSPGPIIAGAICTGFFLLLLAVNLLRGPTCACKLRTAVQTEPLPSLGRVRSASKAIAIIKPLIEAVQGGLSPEDIFQGIAQTAPDLLQTSAASPSATATRGAPPPPIELPPSSGILHTILYLLLIVGAGVGFYRLLHPDGKFSQLLAAFLRLTLCALSFIALIRQRKFALSRPLRNLTIGSFIGLFSFMIVLFVYDFIANLTYTMQHPGHVPTRMDYLGMPGYRQIIVTANSLEALAGIAGLALTAAWISRGRQSVAIPPAPTEPSDPQP